MSSSWQYTINFWLNYLDSQVKLAMAENKQLTDDLVELRGLYLQDIAKHMHAIEEMGQSMKLTHQVVMMLSEENQRLRNDRRGIEAKMDSMEEDIKATMNDVLEMREACGSTMLT